MYGASRGNTLSVEAHESGDAVATTSGIAKLWKPVVNVGELDEGERFWSALTGLSPTGGHGDENCDQNSSLQGPDESLLLRLQLVPRDQTSWIGGTHLDLRVDDAALAVRAGLRRSAESLSRHRPSTRLATRVRHR